MSEEELKVRYINFNPDHSETRRIKSLASTLYYLSPSDSIVKITIEKGVAGFNCKIEIHSAYLHVEENSFSATLIESLAAAQKKVITQINQWKSKRFRDSVTERTTCLKRNHKSA